MPIHVTTRGKPKKKGRTTAIQKKEGEAEGSGLYWQHRMLRGGVTRGKQKQTRVSRTEEEGRQGAQNGPGGRKGRPTDDRRDPVLMPPEHG